MVRRLNYSDYNAKRDNRQQMYSDFEWFLVDFQKEHNISNAVLVEIMHRYIERRIIGDIKIN